MQLDMEQRRLQNRNLQLISKAGRQMVSNLYVFPMADESEIGDLHHNLPYIFF